MEEKKEIEKLKNEIKMLKESVIFFKNLYSSYSS